MSRQRYFVEIKYHGGDFCGWQRQPGVSTVQETIEECLTRLSGNKYMPIVGCGRTDTGVHAHRFFFHMDWWEEIKDLRRFEGKMNAMLPHSISVHDILPVSIDAHARFSATSRTYRYFIHFQKDAFKTDRSALVRYPLDFEAMNEAATHLIGEQDFTSFSRLHTDVKTNICTLTYARWFETNKGEWYFEIRANRFLRNMVRAVVGTLFDVGRGSMKPIEISDILLSRDRKAASTSAPAHGLFLWDIQYDSLLDL